MKIAPFGFALAAHLLTTGVSAQNPSAQNLSIDGEERATLLVGKHRSLIAYAGADHSFTIETGASAAKPSDIPGFITVDKQIIQSTLVPAANADGLAARTTDKEKELLLKYMNYELEYYRKKLKQHYSHLQTEWVSLHGRLFLVWYFDMPENYKLVSRQVYASTLFYGQVMDLNAPVFKYSDWGTARSLILRLAGTMKTYDRRLDLDALRKKL